MSISIAPMPQKPPKLLLGLLLKLNSALKRSVFSRNFYNELNTKVFASTSSVDSVLYFICYFSLLSSSILANKPKIQKFLQDQRLKLVKALTNFGVKFDGRLKSLAREYPIPQTPVPLADNLKAMSSYISDVRIFNRLGDCLKYMPWIIDEYTLFVTEGGSTRFINLLQALNCWALEFFENAGWYTDHKWVTTGDNDWWCMFTYIWSSRIWGVYILIEIIEMIRRTPVSKWDKNWKIGLFKQVIQLPLVLHWSLYEGCLTPFWVGLCGCGASWWGFKDVMNSLNL